MSASPLLGLVGAVLMSASWGMPGSPPDVDVAIAFAVDSSSSIDPGIADMQRSGHAAALRSPDILRTIAANYRGCIAVVYFEWSSPGRTRVVLPWTRICSRGDAEAAAAVIDDNGDSGKGRSIRRGTSISSAIDVGSLLLDSFPGTAAKKLIDISGNGENNDGLPIDISRSRAIAKGYTINAIAIAAPQDRLDVYFKENVIGGPQAFVISLNGAEDYLHALRRKLTTEISLNR